MLVDLDLREILGEAPGPCVKVKQENLKEDSSVLQAQAKGSRNSRGPPNYGSVGTGGPPSQALPQAGPSSLPWASPPEVNTAMALPIPKVLAAWCSSWVMIHSRIQKNGQLGHNGIKGLRAWKTALLDWLESPQSGSPTILSLRFAAWDLWTSSRREPHPHRMTG